jgi:hypothetical protein
LLFKQGKILVILLIKKSGTYPNNLQKTGENVTKAQGTPNATLERGDDDVYRSSHLVGANLRLSGVEIQGTLNATLAHHILLESSHQKGKL